MKKLPLLSVIVPVYNAKKYLDQCIESIVKQTYYNLQIILVDDGSTDGSAEVCDAWSERDKRVHVIHKENGGGAQARNFGLDSAQGDLITFVDSDDCIHKEMYMTLYEVMQEQGAELVECGYTTDLRAWDVVSLSHSKIRGIYNTQQAMIENLQDNILRQLVWNKLYLKETINDVRFVEGKFIDDEFWTYRVIGNAKKSVVIDLPLYYYRQQEDSAMHQKYSLKWLQAVEAKCCRQDYLESRMPEIANLGRIKLLYTCIYHGQLTQRYLDKETQKKAFKLLEQIVKKYKITRKDLERTSISDKAWLLGVNVSFKSVCQIRNMLKIGV